LQIDDIERAAALHWQPPDTERLAEWLLRAAAGFTGRANSALPVGDPGKPLPEAVAAVTDWYRRRGLPPMIAVPGVLLGDSPPHSLETFLAERAWVSRPGPAFVMTADVTDIRLPAADTDFRLDPEPDAGWLALYRYRGQELPPIARTLLMSAPWQAFGSIRRDGRPVAVGRISIGAGWAMITAVEVDPSSRRQGLGAAITGELTAAAAARGARRIQLQVEETNAPAVALYTRCGFQLSHHYHYRIAPA
jgi:ribosomal protein S18 acetylase RimI-like enzyme